LQFLLALIERNPDIYLDEIQAQLQQQHGLIIGISTIWETLTELGLIHKKVSYNQSLCDNPHTSLQLSKAAAERNAACRAHYQFQIGAESPERLVFIDESHIDCHTTYRLFGWAYKGECARVSARFVHGPGYVVITSWFMTHIAIRFSLIPALS
jgi:hypothetical protein